MRTVAAATLLVFVSHAAAQVVNVRDVPGLRDAALRAKPGTEIRLAPGNYPGPVFLTNLKGTYEKPIIIGAADPSKPPVFKGRAECLHLTDPAYVILEDMIFEGASDNGLNIDDGGTYETPAHHVILRRLTVRNAVAKGNHDGMKLSGLDHFLIEDCRVEQWGSGGSAIDMVGCHDGVFERCTLVRPEGPALTGIQMKGGSSDITIRRCRFEHASDRAINLGGSSNPKGFRPAVPEKDAAEARNITVEGCTFIGSEAPIAFVNADGATVRYNTFYRPSRWLFRILQEIRKPQFVPCRNGTIEHNLIVFRTNELTSAVNVGAGTAPETFRFANNFWYCEDNAAGRPLFLTNAESGGVYGKDPLLVDPERGDLTVKPDSPAQNHGAHALP